MTRSAPTTKTNLTEPESTDRLVVAIDPARQRPPSQNLRRKIATRVGILDHIQNTRDSVALYRSDLTRINAMCPIFRDSVESGRAVDKSFRALKKCLEGAVRRQSKLEEQREELNLQRAHKAVLDMKAKRPTEYDGFKVKDFISRDQKLIRGAFEELPSLFSLHFDEIDAIRKTSYLTAIMIYRAAIQPDCKLRARKIFDALHDGHIDYLSAYLSACDLVHAPETFSAELRLPLLYLLSQQTEVLETSTRAVITKVNDLKLHAPSEKTKEAFDLNCRMLQIIYHKSQHLEKVARCYTRRRSGCLTIMPA